MPQKADVPESPGVAFREIEEQSLSSGLPVSRLAILSLFAGVVGSLAAFSALLLPAVFLAIGLSLAALWQLSRNSGMSGANLARIGLGLALLGGSWGAAARYQRNTYLFSQAEKHAREFLVLLANNRPYDALELKQPAPARRVAGTDVKEFYEVMEGDQRQEVDAFLENSAVLAVMKSGPNSDWKLEENVVIDYRSGGLIQVMVRMKNLADPKSPSIDINLRRDASQLLADGNTIYWNVDDIMFPLDDYK